MSDLIERKRAIKALQELNGLKLTRIFNDSPVQWIDRMFLEAEDILRTLPSAEPERIIKIGQRSGKTLESAINYLQSTGWLQEHDRILTQSVEPERKKGEWIEEDLSGYLTPGGNSIYHCSECGHKEGPWPHPRLTNFCPSCGADMRGGDD